MPVRLLMVLWPNRDSRDVVKQRRIGEHHRSDVHEQGEKHHPVHERIAQPQDDAGPCVGGGEAGTGRKEIDIAAQLANFRWLLRGVAPQRRDTGLVAVQFCLGRYDVAVAFGDAACQPGCRVAAAGDRGKVMELPQYGARGQSLDDAKANGGAATAPPESVRAEGCS